MTIIMTADKSLRSSAASGRSRLSVYLASGLLIGIAVLWTMRMVQAQQSFESFTLRHAQDVVSPELLRGPHYKLAANVRTFGYLNNFVVSSDYGVFEGQSDAMLRRAIREIRAITELRKVSTSKAFTEALGHAAMAPVRGVEDLVTKPVETVKAVPTAVFNIFSRVGEGVRASVSGDKTDYEDSAIAQGLQMSAYKRDYATKLGVDPYSSNQVLQKQLNDVSWVAAAGGLTISAATFAIGSPVISVPSNVHKAVNLVAAEPPAELTIRNRASLKKMGISDDVSQRFLEARIYSPRAKTILTEALATLEGTTGRENVLLVALEAPDEVTAIFYQQMAELLSGYDSKVAKIRKLDRLNRVVVAQDTNGRSVVLAPLDYVIWNEQTASAVDLIARSRQLKAGEDSFQFWITGKASPRAKSEASARGIRVQDGGLAQLPLLD